MGIGSQTIKELKSIAYGQEEVNKSLAKKLDTLLASPNFSTKSGMDELLNVLNFDQIQVIGNESTNPKKAN